MMSVISGNTDKLGILYERYKTPLYGYFFKLTGGDRASSEDLVQNVFYKALRYKHSFKGTGEFAKWLFSIAHNIGIDHLRKESRSFHSTLDEGRHEGGYINDSLEKKQDRELLFSALAKLNEDDRELLILSKIKCLKYSEIAEIYNCTESALKTRVFRALNRLKKVFYQFENIGHERK